MKILTISLITLSLLLPIKLFSMEEENIAITVNIDEELLDQEAHFKDGKSLIEFLKKAAGENEAFKDFTIIKHAQKMEQESITSRFWSEQLFWVIAEFVEYVLKEIKGANPINEIKSLQFAAAHPKLRRFVYPNKTEGLQFIFPVSYLRYLHERKEHILLIMPKASGENLLNIMLKFSKDITKKLIKFICMAYFDLGLSMAKFYKDQGTLDNTTIHGDLSNGNIFYDSKSRLITLIDNASVALSLKQSRDISGDLGALFVSSPYVISFTFGNFLNEIDLDRWYAIAIPSYIFGFMSSYEQPERLGVFTQLKDFMLMWRSYIGADGRVQVEAAIKKVLIKNPENDNNLEYQYCEQGKNELEIISENPDLEVLKYLILEKN